jgi:hypothetical protein
MQTINNLGPSTGSFIEPVALAPLNNSLPLQRDPQKSEKREELSRKIQTSVSQLAYNAASSLANSTIPEQNNQIAPLQVETVDDEKQHSERLRSIAYQCFPGAILCARGLLIRLYDGSYSKKLQKEACEISPALFSQNAFLIALAVDMISYQIPFEQCEFFSKFSTDQKERLQNALNHFNETEFANLFLKAIPNHLEQLFAETISKEPVQPDLFCAFLSLADYQNEYLLGAFQFIEKFNLEDFRQQEEAIQSLLAIPYPTERSLCLSEFSKTLFSVNKLKALELVFQIPDQWFLHITLKLLLKQVFLTEGRDALFDFVKSIKNDNDKAKAVRKLIFIVLQKDSSDENLQKLRTYILEIENTDVRAFCLDIFSKQIRNINPKMEEINVR